MNRTYGAARPCRFPREEPEDSLFLERPVLGPEFYPKDGAMLTQVILDNDDATLWYHPDTKIVHHYLKRYVYGDALHVVLELGAKTLESNRAAKWLSDDRNNGALSPADEVSGQGRMVSESASRGVEALGHRATGEGGRTVEHETLQGDLRQVGLERADVQRPRASETVAR
ncbi:MAG: hypothetical protein QM784_13645 [Polyangiaceae bacterium]